MEIRASSISKDEQQLPKIKKLKEFNGLSGSNFTLSLINNKLKDITGIFNVNYKKMPSSMKNVLSKDSKEDISHMTNNSSLNSLNNLNASKPRLLRNN